MNLPQLIHRLRRVQTGLVSSLEYTDDQYADDCENWANACFDKTPITEAFIRSLDVFKFGDIGNPVLTVSTGLATFSIVVNPKTGVVILDRIVMAQVTTRGQLIQLLSALGVWE